MEHFFGQITVFLWLIEMKLEYLITHDISLELLAFHIPRIVMHKPNF